MGYQLTYRRYGTAPYGYNSQCGTARHGTAQARQHTWAGPRHRPRRQNFRRGGVTDRAERKGYGRARKENRKESAPECEWV